MGWARIDDAFDDHEKVLALLDLEEGAAALGLWTLCLTWAHRNTRKKGKTPGLLPTTLPRRFLGPRGRELAAILVEVRLWDVVDDGWMIHDFAEYLPDKEVSAARSAAGRKGAAARWGNRQTDGKLPSADGKSDGKPMAGDGDANAKRAPKATDPPPGTPFGPADGNEPFEDGKLPSVSHPSDGKPVANDGSRAGARRVRVDVGTTVLFPEPGPEPVPPSAGADAPTTTDQLIGDWLDHVPKRPPGTVISQVGKHIKAMLDGDGIDPADVRRGIAEWATKGLHPSALPSVVNEVMNGRPRAPARGPRTTPPTTRPRDRWMERE